jgi:hypothetical protein
MSSDLIIDPDSIKSLSPKFEEVTKPKEGMTFEKQIITKPPTIIQNPVLLPPPVLLPAPDLSKTKDEASTLKVDLPKVIAPVDNKFVDNKLVEKKNPPGVNNVPHNVASQVQSNSNIPAPKISNNPPSKKPADNNYKYSDWKGSIMFSLDKIKALNDAISDFNLGKTSTVAPSAILPNTNKIDSILDLATKNDVSPSFYLNSIIYVNEDNWKIWIDRKKIDSNKINELKFIIPELNLLNITNSVVTFSWRTQALDTLSPNWKKKLNFNKDDNSFYSDNEDILIKNNGGNITFKLRPNQTFVLYNMEIKEGFTPDHQLKN